MNCKDIEKLLPAYVADELTSEQKRIVEEHLDKCPDCRTTFNELTAIGKDLAFVKDAVPAKDMRGTIMKTIQEKRQKRRIWLKPGLVAAPLIVLLAVIMVWHPWMMAPQTVVAKAQSATADLQSYRLTEDIHNADGEHVMVVTEYGDPDWHMTVILNGTVEAEYILSGEKVYYRDITSTDSLTLKSIQYRMLNNSTSAMLSTDYTLSMLDFLTDIKELPETTINGTLCIHYSGSYDYEKQLKRVREELGLPPMSEEDLQQQLDKIEKDEQTLEFDLLIGKDDYIIREMTVTSTFTDHESDEPVSSVTTNTFSGFNEPVTIKAPLDSEGNLLDGWLTTAPDEPNINVEMSSVIDNYDPSSRRITYTITFTNISGNKLNDIELQFVSSSASTGNDIVFSYHMESSGTGAEPGAANPMAILREDETLVYSAVFFYDATVISADIAAGTIEKKTILFRYTQSDGQHKEELFRFDVPQEIYTLSADLPKYLIPVDLIPVGEYFFTDTSAYAGSDSFGKIDGRDYLFSEVSASGLEGVPAGILILDISDRVNPVRTAYIDTGDDVYFLNGSYLHETTLYVFTSDYLWILDVSDPAKPEELNKIHGLDARQMAVSGNTAFINESSHYITSLDVTDPANPQELDKINIDSRTSTGLKLDGDYIFYKANSSLLTIDASDPSSLRVVNEYSFENEDETVPDHIVSWDIRGNNLYVALGGKEQGAVAVLDISDPESIKLETMHHLHNRHVNGGLFIDDNRLYIFTRSTMPLSSRESRLECFDISKPSEIKELGYGMMPDAWDFIPEPDGGYVSSHSVIGHYLYWFLGDSPNNLPVIEVFDLNDISE